MAGGSEMTSRRALLAAGLAVGVAPGVSQAAGLSNGECRRGADGQISLTWTGPKADVRMATRPEGPFTKVLASGADRSWRGAAPISPRPYFRLTAASGGLDVAERLLPLKGGRNFRDLGGYRTTDGRVVRWGKLYRSGSMVDLTPEDYGYLSSLGVAVICDFRATSERDQEPTRWTGPGAPTMLSRDYESDRALQKALFEGSADAASTRALMAKVYESLPYDHADSYRTMFAQLVAGKAPLAFNCSAGKDRTGVAAALLLTTLGVPRSVVLADYTLTNDVIDFEVIRRRSPAAKPPAGFPAINQLSAEARAQLQTADPAYLEAAFDSMKRREGSVEAFVRLRLGVSDADVQTLRSTLLKSA